MLFAFKLARSLGKSVSELFGSMDADEFFYWMAYDKIDPLPQPWLQTGLACAVQANSVGNKCKPEDFMPLEKKRATAAEVLAAMQTAWRSSG